MNRKQKFIQQWKRKGSVFSFLFFVLLFHFFSSCEKRAARHQQTIQWMQDDKKVKVLTTTNMINDLVKEIGGDYVNSMSLIQGELDPHSYQLVKGDDEKLRYAEIIFYNGLVLEHGPSLYQYLMNSDRAVALGDWLEKQNKEQIIYVNGYKDPHVWMDIELWSQTIPLIVETLSEQTPQHASYYRENGRKLQLEMAAVHHDVTEQLHAIPEKQRYLVTSHDAFNYFARAYLSEQEERKSGRWRKRFAAPEGLAPESQLSTSHIRAIIDYLKAHQVHLLFPETNVSQDSIRKIVQAGKEEGLDIQVACCPLYGDAMGPLGSEGESYLKMIRYNGRVLAEQMNDQSKKLLSEKY